MLKDDASIESIEFKGEDFEVGISQQEASYFEKVEGLQVTPDYKVKGFVTAFDKKTGIGRFTISQKRIVFELSAIEPNSYEEVVLKLIESMKGSISVYLIGDATFDYESNIKKMVVKKIESETKLL